MVADLERSWHGDGTTSLVVVLVNSLGARQSSWRELIDKITDHARVLTFDLPGHVRAEGKPFSFDDVVESVVRLLDDEGVHAARLCGVSLGGALAVAVAARRPDIASALVTVNAPLRQPSPQFWRNRAAEVEQHGLAHLASDLPNRWFTPAADRDAVARLVEEFGSLPAEGYAQMCRAIADLDATDGARLVRVPATVIAGTADVAVAPAEAGRYAELIDHAELVLVPGAPHLLPVECPDRLAEHVLGPFRRRS